MKREDDVRSVAPAANAWRTWLLVGATGFGGPAGQIAILHREVVERRQWLTEDEFLAAMRVCMLLPGPEAQQLATYAGWRLGGISGGLLAGTLFVVPGAVIVALLAWLHAAGETVPLVTAAFAGVRPAVVALVALAAWRIGRRSLRTTGAVAVAAASLATLASGVPFPLAVAAVGIAAWLAPRLAGDATAANARPEPRSPSGVGIGRVATVFAWASLVWLGCDAVVRQFGLAGGAGSAIARLFTETTLLSLGGAYAVVPWALDESVNRGWLVEAERFDALAMGEATPGPLILVVTFIGFMAGWRAAPAAAVASGFEGAAVATVFAFLPSFALIFGVAPFVRSVLPGSRLEAAMSAIGAVVVAAIVLLGVRLAAAAFLPVVAAGMVSLAVAVACGWLLHSGRISAPVAVIAAAGIGILRAL